MSIRFIAASSLSPIPGSVKPINSAAVLVGYVGRMFGNSAVPLSNVLRSTDIIKFIYCQSHCPFGRGVVVNRMIEVTSIEKLKGRMLVLQVAKVGLSFSDDFGL
uniref:Uncharacterized protein n=1 Tax=Candidozyma auris TaxID=498019 RepID=A0A0L0P753_CANAR